MPVGNRDLQESEMYRVVYTYHAKIVIDLAERTLKPITVFALFAHLNKRWRTKQYLWQVLEHRCNGALIIIFIYFENVAFFHDERGSDGCIGINNQTLVTLDKSKLDH